MNQLIREDNRFFDKTVLCTYDNSGNILTKKEYVHNPETPTELLSQKNYAYPSTGWKDKLSSVNNQPIIYDVLGNPLNYLGHTLTWDRVRQLKTFDNNTFAYDGFGKRCRKNSVYYLYDGDKLIKERRNGTSLVYFYDTTGICGFRYNIFTGGVNSTDYYFYRKNLQGDVTAILDQNGNIIAEYLYDAWGKCYITYDPTGIGEINPIRYRSYYYDIETGLYYLNSRYYDPNTGRFINADEISCIGASENIISNNLYSYCYNNPANMIDGNGYLPFFVLTGIAGAIIGGVVGYVSTGSWKGALVGVAVGTAIGLTGGATVATLFAGGATASTGAVAVGIHLKIAGLSTIGYASFDAFKKVYGRAGDGKAWHHIVEQTPANISKFGAEFIHNARNIVKIPHGANTLHNLISGHYSSVKDFTNGMRVRDWLATKEFDFQLKYGLEILSKYAKDLGITIEYVK